MIDLALPARLILTPEFPEGIRNHESQIKPPIPRDSRRKGTTAASRHSVCDGTFFGSRSIGLMGRF